MTFDPKFEDGNLTGARLIPGNYTAHPDFACCGFNDLHDMAVVELSMSPSTGSGGTCYGDSGGPHFVGDVAQTAGKTTKIVSLTVTGDAVCRATDVTYRLDTDSARAFLDDFVTLP